MLGNTDRQGPLSSCSDVRLLLEKSIAEDVISTDEQRILDSHLNQCRKCRDLARLTSDLPIFAEATVDGEFDADIEAVMAVLHTDRQSARRRKTWWAAVAVAATIAAATVVGVTTIWDDGQGEGVPITSIDCHPSALKELVPGVFMVHCVSCDPETHLDDGTVRVLLHRGAVALYVDPSRPVKQSVTIETPLGSVRVKGTLFTVRVEEGNTRVDVYRGTVEVIPEAQQLSYRVTAGFGTELKHRVVFKGAEPTADTLVRALPVDIDGAHPDGILSGIDTPPDYTSESFSSRDAGDRGPTGVRKSIRKKRRSGMADAPRGTGTSMDTLIQDAQSCMLIRDWECAASRYREITKKYSHRPESASVLISLAKVELRHLRQPKEALAHYSNYLQVLPNGPLAEEALLGTAESYRRLGLEAQEKDNLRSFLKRFPNSSLAGKARFRLNQLEKR